MNDTTVHTKFSKKQVEMMKKFAEKLGFVSVSEMIRTAVMYYMMEMSRKKDVEDEFDFDTFVAEMRRNIKTTPYENVILDISEIIRKYSDDGKVVKEGALDDELIKIIREHLFNKEGLDESEIMYNDEE